MAVAPQLNPRQNRLLAALPDADFNRIQYKLEPFSFALGQSVYEPGSIINHLYFPCNGIISMLHVMADGPSAEIALTGNDGVVGITVIMGSQSTTTRAVVQSTCAGYRLDAETVREEFDLGGELQRCLLRYSQALMTQMSQTAVCNRHHEVDQHLCRWLLLSLDLLPGNRLSMTQVLIANMLGVRREGVSAAAAKLQAAKIIKYSRGTITVINRRKLENRVCECYSVVKTETDRLLNAPYGLLKAESKVESAPIFSA